MTAPIAFAETRGDVTALKPRWKVKQGHVLDVLHSLPPNWAQCCVTSPPYWGLRDYGLPPQIWGGDAGCAHAWGATMPSNPPTPHGGLAFTGNGAPETRLPRLSASQSGERNSGSFCERCNAWRGSFGLEPTPELYIAHLVEIFGEVRRVLRPDGTLWLNLGDSYAGSRAGPQGATGQMIDRSVAKAEGRTRYQTLRGEGLKYKDLVGIPWMAAFALRADGWFLRSDNIWFKGNPMPESVRDRPTKAHEYVFLLSKSAEYYYDAEAIKEPVSGTAHHRGSNGSKKARGQSQRTGVKANESFNAAVTDLVEMRNKRSVWAINSQPYSGAHFATMPEALVEPCVLAGTSAHGNCASCGAGYVRVVEKADGTSRGSGQVERVYAGDVNGRLETHMGSGVPWVPQIVVDTKWVPSCGCTDASVKPAVVLEPFAGSGTVLSVAVRLGRDAYGVELNPEYVKLAHARIGCDGCEVCCSPTTPPDARAALLGVLKARVANLSVSDI